MGEQGHNIDNNIPLFTILCDKIKIHWQQIQGRWSYVAETEAWHFIKVTQRQKKEHPSSPAVWGEEKCNTGMSFHVHGALCLCYLSVFMLMV